MAQTQFTIPASTFPIGATRQSASLPAGALHSFSVSSDASQWKQPSTTSVEVIVESSFDGGTSYQPTVSVKQTSLPPWSADGGTTTSAITFSTNYGSSGTSPTNIRLTVNVAGHSVLLGPTVVTVN